MRRLYAILSIVLGNLIYALSVKFFLLPAGLITGGTNGIALVLEHYWGVSITLFVLVFNIVMLCNQHEASFVKSSCIKCAP